MSTAVVSLLLKCTNHSKFTFSIQYLKLSPQYFFHIQQHILQEEDKCQLLGGITMPENDDGGGCRKTSPRVCGMQFVWGKSAPVPPTFLPTHPFLVSQACATSLTCPKFSAQRRESGSRRIGPCLLLFLVRAGQSEGSAIGTRSVPSVSK